MGLSFSWQRKLEQQEAGNGVPVNEMNDKLTVPSNSFSRTNPQEVQNAKRKLFKSSSPINEMNDSTVKVIKKNHNSFNLQHIRLVPWNNSSLCFFFKIFDDEKVQNFLWMDPMARICDKYLLAMVYTYFLRAGLSQKEFTRGNFFVALFLAHDMEEDDEDIKFEIFPWCLGKHWQRKISLFLQRKDQLWRRMNYRSLVSCRTCDEVMQLCPAHPIWQRERRVSLGGAIDPLVVVETISLPSNDSKNNKTSITSRRMKRNDSPAFGALAKKPSVSNSRSTTSNNYLSIHKGAKRRLTTEE